MKSIPGFSCHTAHHCFDCVPPLLNLKSIIFHPSYNVQGEQVMACFFTITFLHLKAADMIALTPHQDEHS